MEKPPKEVIRRIRRVKELQEDDSPRIILTDQEELESIDVPSEVPATRTLEDELQEAKKESVFTKEFESGKRSYAKIIKHALIMILVLLLGYGFDHLLLLAGDPKIWNYIPWRYVLHGADVMIVIRVVITIVKELGKDD